MFARNNFNDQQNIFGDGNSEGLGLNELFEEEENGENEELGIAELFTENVPFDTMDVGGASDAVEETEEEKEALEKPEDYLRVALNIQGLNMIPEKLKVTWEGEGYQYTVRIHGGNPVHTKAAFIYRVARQAKKVDEYGRRGEVEYLGTDGHWYGESSLRETCRNGNQNSNFSETAARNTHIPLDRDRNIFEEEEEEEQNE